MLGWFWDTADDVSVVFSQHNLERSRAYEGPNTRLRRVLQKAADGHPINIGVLGGSGMCSVLLVTFG